MKLSFILLVFSLLKINASGYSQSTKISLSLEDVTIENVFSEIKSKTEFKIFFMNSEIDLQRRISIKVKKQRIEKILSILFDNTNITHEIIGKQIVLRQNKTETITKPRASIDLINSSNIPQQQEIKGTILDANNIPLAGVNILVKGTSRGTQTNFDGNYTLRASNGETLVISYIGFVSQEIVIGNETTINLTLEEDAAQLDEVVVVGYGTQQKRVVTGAISSIKEDVIRAVPVTNAIEALQGNVAGVDITRGSGAAGAGVSIRIRGNRSLLASNEPLIVVDGIPLSGGTLDINPNNIQSMEVLKDAAATAIYGSRGANGVIIITSKKGKKGKTTISYDSFIGMTNKGLIPEIFNGEEYTNFKREAARTDGVWSSPADDALIFNTLELESIAQGRETDWVDLVLQNGLVQSHQIGVLGGGERTNYNLSLSYYKEEGYVKVEDFQRINLNSIVDYQINDRIKVGANTNLSYRAENNGAGTIYSEAQLINPLAIPYDENGELTFRPTTGQFRVNPLNNFVSGRVKNEETDFRALLSLYAEYAFSDHLSFRTNIGLSVSTGRNGLFLDSQTVNRREDVSQTSFSIGNSLNYNWDNIINYNNEWGDHSLSATAIFGIQEDRNEGFSGQGVNQPIQDFEFYNIDQTEQQETASGLSRWQLASVAGRFTYGYKGKYLLNGSIRYDGSSRLAEGNEWDVFPAISFAWRAIDEPFLQDSNVFSDLKIRASYGTVGNTSISPFQTLSTLSRLTFAFGEEQAFGYRPSSISNPLLSWEKSTTVNFGVDYGFFNNKLRGSIEVYRTNTTDLLQNRSLPITSGFSRVTQNIGETQNQGIEVTLNTVNMNTKDFQWNSTLTFSTNKEEIVALSPDNVVELNNGLRGNVGNRWFLGQPLQVYYDYEKIGIWQLGEEDAADVNNQNPGEIRVRDISNAEGQEEGTISSDEDRTIIGTNRPDWTAGLRNTINYKGFDFSFSLFSRFGQTITRTIRRSVNGRDNSNVHDYWTPENPTNAFPRPDFGTTSTRFGSTLNYVDGSFLKLREVTLGYDLASTLNTPGLSRCRVYVNAKNVFAIRSSDLKGFDPENTNTTEPITSLFTFGLNLTF